MREGNIRRLLVIGAMAVLGLISAACSRSTQPSESSYKDAVQNALRQADLTDVSVDENKDKNTITLSGTLHSQDAKDKAAQVAQSAAGNRVIANEISVEPVGAESDAKKIASNVDDGIESNYKAALIAHGLAKEHIRYDAKNGVLTLKGRVRATSERQQAEQLASNVPNVAQVVNQIEVSR